jgi:hypothetical protein
LNKRLFNHVNRVTPRATFTIPVAQEQRAFLRKSLSWEWWPLYESDYDDSISDRNAPDRAVISTALKSNRDKLTAFFNIFQLHTAVEHSDR